MGVSFYIMEKYMNKIGLEIIEGQTQIPAVVMPVRVNGDFEYLNTREQFAGKRVIIFALPGAFTPTCSSFQLPGFETMFSQSILFRHRHLFFFDMPRHFAHEAAILAL